MIFFPVYKTLSDASVKILIVDDNLMNRIMVERALHKKGYHTDFAENGIIAIAKVELTDYDLILMDLQMPEMDGYEATMQVRARCDYKRSVPVIAMTANAYDGAEERCMASGMNGFITKPFPPDELYDKITQLLPCKANIF